MRLVDAAALRLHFPESVGLRLCRGASLLFVPVISNKRSYSKERDISRSVNGEQSPVQRYSSYPLGRP